MYTLFDQAAETYAPPFYARSDNEAIRTIMNVLKQPDNHLTQSPQDFTLCKVGQFDDSDCSINLVENSPSRVHTLLEIKKQLESVNHESESNKSI